MLVDTTCGSVLNVWKRVESYARDGFTAVIHGKHYHEETKATASQVTKYPGGRYLVVLNMDEARIVCDFIEHGGDVAALAARFAQGGVAGVRFRARPGAGGDRQPDDDALRRVAGDRRRRSARSMERRYGADGAWRSTSGRSTPSAPPRRSGRTRWWPCSQEPLDVMVVVGGYNSSNTCHLAALVQSRACAPIHIEDAAAVDPAARHDPPPADRHQARRQSPADWLGAGRVIGITAGASTPNNKVGETIARICELAGVGEELRA